MQNHPFQSFETGAFAFFKQTTRKEDLELKASKEGNLSRMTVLSYALGYGSGKQFICAIVGTYISVFLTDTFGVSAAVVGVIMVVATIWDAVYSLILGGLADRTNTRFGRYRPYLLVVPIPLSIATVALFSCPDLTSTGKIIWTAVFYFIFSMLVTTMQIPYGAIINAVTNLEDQRQRMIGAYTTTMGIATTIASSFALVFIEVLGKGDTARGYMSMLAIAGVIMIITSWMCFGTTKERFVSHTAPEPLLTQIKKLVKIKALLPILLVWCMGAISFQCMMSASVYYINYYIGNPALMPTYMLVISLIGLMGIVIVLPIFSKLFHEMRTGFMVSQGIGAVSSLLLFFFGGYNIVLLYILSGISAIFFTMSQAYIPMMVSETIDYVYFRTGEQLNATIGAMRGFANKCGSALTSGILMFTLSLTGYEANAPAQTDLALFGIDFARFLVPAITAVIVIVCLRFYPVNRQVKQEMAGLYQQND